jgi:hypothetical protein
VTDEDQRRTISQPGTARALVGIASALALGGAVLICLVTLVFGPALLDAHGLTGPAIWGTVGLCAVVAVAVVTANVLAARGRTTSAVVARGCGAVLGGVVVGLALLLIVIANAG